MKFEHGRLLFILLQYPNGMTSSQLQEGEENMMKYILRKLNRSFDILEVRSCYNVVLSRMFRLDPFFNSHGPKGKMSFSHHLTYVVPRPLSVPFLQKSSPLKLVRQIVSNLAHSSLGYNQFKKMNSMTLPSNQHGRHG